MMGVRLFTEMTGMRRRPYLLAPPVAPFIALSPRAALAYPGTWGRRRGSFHRIGKRAESYANKATALSEH